MANVCDYSTMTHYNSGEFNSMYKTKLEGNIIKIDKEIIKDETVLKSFKDEFYETFITNNDLILYRVYGRFKRKNNEKIFGAKLTGSFVTTEFAESVYDVKMRMALDQLWGNPKMFEAKILVPKGTLINVGLVAPVISKSGTIFTGGADQILLPKDWPSDWVVGYRRVSMRQLQQVPVFTEGVPKDEIMNVEDLYKPRTCPMCGSANNIIVYHGEDSDYGEVVCDDGTTCVARYKLLELADRLSKTSGKKVYGYLKPDVKALVDSIVEELASDERIKKLYDLWYEQKENTIKTYTDEMPNRIPLVDNKEFKSIKNAVIKEALKLNLTGDEAEESENTDEESVSNPFEYEENTSAESDFDSDKGVMYPQYSIKTKRNSVAVSSLYLLRYLCNMIQSRLRFEEKQKAQRTDKKLQQKINDKKQAQGLKM